MAGPADEMLDQLKKQTELLEKLVPKGESKPGGKGGNAVNMVAGVMSNLGTGRIANAGTALSSLTNNIQKLGDKGGSGKVGAALGALGAGKQLASNAMGAMGGVMKGMGKAIGGVVSIASMAAGPIGMVGAALGGVMGPLTGVVDSIKGLFDSITSFVSLANPGAIIQFTFAMNDLMAVIGGMLTPVMQGLTIYARAAGDSFAKLAPVLQPLFDKFGQWLADSVMMTQGFIEAFAPLLQIAIDGVIPMLEHMAKAMAFLNGILIEVLNTISEMLGLSSRFDPNAEGKGAARRQTSVQSVEGFANAAFAKSIQGIFAGGQGKNPESQRDDIKKAIEEGREIVREIRTSVKEVADWVRDPRVRIVKALTDVLGLTDGKIQNSANDAMNGLMNFKNSAR